MTDFKKWYALHDPDLDLELDDLFETVQQAFEAGAASQEQTLRDLFAGQALAGLCADPKYSRSNEMYAARSYKMADAMLEARNMTKEQRS
jgi:hypothetical protein